MNKYQKKMKSLQCYDLAETIGMRKDVSQEDIQELQRQTNCELPKDYIEFVKMYGGFSFEEYVNFTYLEKNPRDSDKGDIDVFFGFFLENISYDIIHEYRCYCERIPVNCLPIASAGGNVVCLSVKGNDKGSVYLWDHNSEEAVEEGEEPGTSNIYLLSHSFDNFINSLDIDREEEED